MKSLITLITLIKLITAPAMAGSITITGAAGEFENRIATERYTLEARSSGDLYGIAYGAINEHPLDEVDDRIMLGAGYRWRDWNAELIGNDERYLARLMFTAPTEVWEVRGGVLHGNRWEEGFKQTGLKVSVGYPVGPVSVGGFYEIGNTTMTAVDDLYGGYLTIRW